MEITSRIVCAIRKNAGAYPWLLSQYISRANGVLDTSELTNFNEKLSNQYRVILGMGRNYIKPAGMPGNFLDWKEPAGIFNCLLRDRRKR